MATLNGNITKLYWIYGLNNSDLQLVVYTLFILSKGFTMQQFFLMGTVYTIVNLATEIPAGIFSDRVSRKWSMIICSIISIPSTFIVITSQTYIPVLLATAAGGLASSFLSGTDTALLYDTLIALDREDEFQQVLGKTRWYGSWIISVGGIIGGFLGSISLSYPMWAWFFTGYPAVLAIQSTLKEPPVAREPASRSSYVLHLKESFLYSIKRESGFFVFYAAVIGMFFAFGFWLIQPYLEFVSLPVMFFGFLYAAGRLISGFVSRNSFFIEKRIGMSGSLLFIPLVLAAAFFLESQIAATFGFLFILIQSVSGGHFAPTLETYINSRIPSSRRATVLSFKNMLQSLLYGALAPFLGYIIDSYSLQTAYLIMAAVIIFLTAGFFLIFRAGLSRHS